MIGKKKEEDWEFIGTEDYFDENEYGRIMTEEDKQEKKIKENTETEFLENLFRPYLISDEQILCVIGSGAGDNENPLQNKKTGKAGKKIMIVRNVIVGFFVVGFVLAFIGVKIGFLMVLPLFILRLLAPVAAIAGIVVLLLWALNSAPKGMNFAVTNKMILSYGYKYFQQLRIREITDISVSMKNDNTGSITIKAKGTGSYSALYTILKIPSVNDPFKIKSMIEKAKNDLSNNLSGGSAFGQTGNAPKRPSTSYNPDAPLTAYDKPVRAPYYTKSSDNMNN